MGFSFASLGFLWMYVSLFPSFSKTGEQMLDYMKSFPEGLMKAFGMTDLASMFLNIENFLATEQFSIIWPLMLIFLVSAFAGASLSGEIEKGTIEYLLAKPISRLKLFFSRYFAGAAALMIFCIFSILTIAPLSKIYNVATVFKNHLIFGILALLFGMCIFSLTAFFSAIFSERSKTYMFSGGILICMYVFNILASLKDNLDFLKYFSFFHYYNVNQALTQGRIETLSWLVFLLSSALCAILAAYFFKKRDIAT